MKDINILQYVVNINMIHFLLGKYNFVILNLYLNNVRFIFTEEDSERSENSVKKIITEFISQFCDNL